MRTLWDCHLLQREYSVLCAMLNRAMTNNNCSTVTVWSMSMSPITANVQTFATFAAVISETQWQQRIIFCLLQICTTGALCQTLTPRTHRDRHVAKAVKVVMFTLYVTVASFSTNTKTTNPFQEMFSLTRSDPFLPSFYSLSHHEVVAQIQLRGLVSAVRPPKWRRTIFAATRHVFWALSTCTQ